MLTAIVGFEGILKLARSRSPNDRTRLMLALANLTARQDGARPEIQGLLGEILIGLIGSADAEARERVAEILAASPGSPRSVARKLAADAIAIARPVLALSPALTDGDLVALLGQSGVEHAIEIARRPQIGAAVVQAILRRGEAEVLAALAGNATAKVGEPDMIRLIGASRRFAALRAPLTLHPQLTAEQAYALYGWVGEVLQGVLRQRFQLDPAVLARTAAAVASGAGSAPIGGDRLEMERQVVCKLRGGGALRPDLLVRALNEGKLALFVAGLSALSGWNEPQLHTATEADDGAVLGLACADAGVDRSVIPSLLGLVATVKRRGRPALPGVRVPRLADGRLGERASA